MCLQECSSCVFISQGGLVSLTTVRLQMLQLLLQRARQLVLFEELVTLWQFSSFRNQLEFLQPEYNQ